MKSGVKTTLSADVTTKCPNDLIVLRGFTNRGKHDVKYSYFEDTNIFRTELPKNRLPIDRSIVNIAAEIDMCRKYIFKIFTEVVKHFLSEANNNGNAKLISYDLLAFDFSVILPEY
jgi:hypothetical protein